MEQGSTETLLFLGAKDPIAGYSHQKDSPPEGFTLDELTELSSTVSNSEQLRDVDTDMIVSPFKDSWTPDAAGSREEWQQPGRRHLQFQHRVPGLRRQHRQNSFPTDLKGSHGTR